MQTQKFLIEEEIAAQAVKIQNTLITLLSVFISSDICETMPDEGKEEVTYHCLLLRDILDM
jgi:hypothetical protein